MAFAAFLLRLKARRRWIPAFFAVVYTTCILSTAYAQSPKLNLPNPIILGVRDTVKVIKEDFCEKAFKSALENELKKAGLNSFSVKTWLINNQDRGEYNPRYDGLIKGGVHIECGPNSESSGELIYKQNNEEDRSYKNLVSFSDSFYSTNIKLLLKKQLIIDDKLNSLSEQDLKQWYVTHRIGFMPGKTTELQFKETDLQGNKLYPNSIRITVSPDGDARRTALDELTRGNIDALANDGIILRSYLENDPALNEYDIFPSGDLSLPYLAPENYVIAFPKNSKNYSIGNLEDTINKALINPVVQEQRLKIKAYEDGVKVPPSPPASTSPTTSQAPDSNVKNTDDNLSKLILGFVLLIGLLFLCKRFIKRLISWIVNYLIREISSNNPPAQPAPPPRPYVTTPPPETETSLREKKNNERRRRLREALVAGFPTKSKLEQMLSLRLDENLDTIASGDNLQTIVFNLIIEAEVRGWLEDLVRAAYQENPGNEKLIEIYKEFFPNQNNN